MALRLLSRIELPAHRSNGEFDHADIHPPTNRIYVAHTSNGSIGVVDCARDRYLNRSPALLEWPVNAVEVDVLIRDVPVNSPLLGGQRRRCRACVWINAHGSLSK